MPLTECPMRQLRRARDAEPALLAELDRYVTTYYPLYEDGHLLEPGGVAAQPARYLDLITEIRSLTARVQLRYDELRAKDDGEP